jgi:hypothetical protein
VTAALLTQAGIPVSSEDEVEEADAFMDSLE